MRLLTPLEARVLGVLVEKQATVPDSYPLSLNALVLGCNQKTARDPVMQAGDDEVLAAVDGLKGLSLLFEVSGSRVVRFEHNMPRALQVPGAAAALLAVLVLRGPQTAAELRLNCERLHRFADISSVEAFLEELATKEPHRALKLPRAPGEREARWVHLLSGEPASTGWVPRAVSSPGDRALGSEQLGAGEISALLAEQTRLARDVERLRSQVDRLARELGINLD